MRTLSLTALFATLLFTSTAQAQFSGQFTIPTRKVGPITVSLGGYPPVQTAHQHRLPCGTDPNFLNQPRPGVWPDLQPYPFPQPQPQPQPWPNPQPPLTQNLPADLQGVWYEVSPQQTRYVYDLRARDYDMYEMDPATNRVMVGQDGQALQLLREPLAYSNGMLTLSPGPDQDGPLMISAPPPQYPLGRTLTPLAGGSVRYITRRPVKIRGTTTIPTPTLVKGHNVKMVTFKMQGRRSMFAETSTGVWTETNPEETFAYRETRRDEWSVYLTRTDGAGNVQLDLYDKLIRVDGRDTHRIDQAF